MDILHEFHYGWSELYSEEGSSQISCAACPHVPAKNMKLKKCIIHYMKLILYMSIIFLMKITIYNVV